MTIRTTAAALLGFACCYGANAAVTQIDLDYNFNGIVHAGESGLPDDPDGYRSISDRGLDFTGGVPNDATLNQYQLVGQAGALDIVHLGNRNLTDGGNHAFDAAVDGDNVGIQPNWLPNVDQTGPQTTVLGAPILLGSGSSASFLYQISNGGGDFDVEFGFQGGGSTVVTLSGPDWFGPNGGTPAIGTFAGTDGQDQGNTGAATLLITESVVDLSGFAGQTLESISFQNQSNTSAGYAILAANVDNIPEPGSLALLGLGGLAILRRRRG